MEPYWEPNGHAQHPVKYESDAAVAGFPYCGESGLNFSTSTTAYSEDDAEYAPGRRGKTSRQDPLSHRIIEKRRRDRMNSCLADLSRLIPPQYQRKGRGRIEKTEIIEMAIRHLKHLQNECVHKEIEYKLGYTDCMKEAAKFLYEGHMQDICYQLIAHLQEHCEESLKSECFKSRCNTDTISASSGSPPAHNYHPAAPLSQLRDMLTSDIEHSNSNDQHDVKDLSFRSQHQPHQAPTITSTAPSSIHHDSSNHDFDSSREPPSSHPAENGIATPLHHLHHHHHHHTADNILRSARMRNFSESSHDIEHNNNYKYKNDIKQRFHQDSHHINNDESTSEHSINANHLSENSSTATTTIATTTLNPVAQTPATAPVVPQIPADQQSHLQQQQQQQQQQPQQQPPQMPPHPQQHHQQQPPQSQLQPLKQNLDILNCKKRKISNNGCEIIEKSDETKPTSNGIGEIKSETPIVHQQPHHNHHHATSKITMNGISGNNGAGRHFAVPIFALHGQGTYYVPLNIDFEALLPYLNGIDLLDKNFCNMPTLHPVNINVNFTSNYSRQNSLPRPKIETAVNGW